MEFRKPARLIISRDACTLGRAAGIGRKRTWSTLTRPQVKHFQVTVRASREIVQVVPAML
jgi:hypothetical protein